MGKKKPLGKIPRDERRIRGGDIYDNNGLTAATGSVNFISRTSSREWIDKSAGKLGHHLFSPSPVRPPLFLLGR